MYRALGDRVALWVTLNEPWVVTHGGYRQLRVSLCYAKTVWPGAVDFETQQRTPKASARFYLTA